MNVSPKKVCKGALKLDPMDELSNEWASELTRADYSYLPSREDTPLTPHLKTLSP